jgi:hypothetical protein
MRADGTPTRKLVTYARGLTAASGSAGAETADRYHERLSIYCVPMPATGIFLRVLCGRLHPETGSFYVDCSVYRDFVVRGPPSRMFPIRYVKWADGNVPSHGNIMRDNKRFDILHNGTARTAAIAAAGELACDFGVVPWQQGEALEAALRCFTAWLDVRGGAEAGEVQIAIAQVQLFIQQHGDSRFQPINSPDRTVINRAGWRRGDGADRQWLLPSETWKSEVAVGLNPRLVASVLAERGMLKRAPDGLQCVERIQGVPQRVYVVMASILSEPGHE